MIERCFIKMMVLVGLLMVGVGGDVVAQLHEVGSLRWVPTRA